MIALERRLETPRWLGPVVPLISLGAALLLAAVLLGSTHHNPFTTYRRIVEAGFTAHGSFSATLVSATPLLFTGLAAAIAFRMRVWNIGGEGQLYMGAIGASGIGLVLGGRPTALIVPAMIGGGVVAGALWALLPALLRAYFGANEILTSLMLNYLGGLVLLYLIFDSTSYWRDLTTFSGKVFPQGKTLSDRASWPNVISGGLTVPLGFALGLAIAVLLWLIVTKTRFGFEMRVIGDSPAAGRYAGMRTRRVFVAVMLISGAMAGLAGASQIGDFGHVLDPRGLQQSAYGYTGIVVAALSRYNPLAVVLGSVFLGALVNAGFSLQGADFPIGLVGTMQGIILACVVGGELLVRYRVRVRRFRRAGAAPAPEPVRTGQAV